MVHIFHITFIDIVVFCTAKARVCNNLQEGNVQKRIMDESVKDEQLCTFVEKECEMVSLLINI